MISREEAKGYFKESLDLLCYNLGEEQRQAYELAMEALSQPERPKGRWIWKINKIGNGCHCVCSECGRTENKQEPFCNCGADMRGEGE